MSGLCEQTSAHARWALNDSNTGDELPGENPLDVPSEADFQEVSYNTCRAKSFPQVLPVPFLYWERERGKLTVSG